MFEFAEKGPNTSITCDEAAYMGGKIDFMADLSDDKYPLSVINAKLYWDVETGDPVSEVEIRTESEGTYAGSLAVPFQKGDKLSFSGIEDIDSWYFEPDHFNVKEDGVYQFTGIAVEETDGQTIGGRWRYDYISMKFFGQAGWGAEYGTVTLTAEAQKYLGAAGNIELASGVQLEKGATYVMTVTNCTALNSDNKFDCTVDFKKL